MHPIIRQFAKRVLLQFIVRQIQKYHFQQQLAHFHPYLVTKQVGDVKLDVWIADQVDQLWYDGKETGKSYEMEFIRMKQCEIYIQWEDNQPPQPYHQEDITRRVHLFFLPR